MFTRLIVGLPVMLLCLLLQAIFVTLCVRYYARHKLMARDRDSTSGDFMLLSGVLLLLALCNFFQIGVWAALFMLLGEFGEFETALYHSGVNFVTLGYGDIVMSERWRLLGPIEAANGILMFGVSTALITAAVMDILKANRAKMQDDAGR